MTRRSTITFLGAIARPRSWLPRSPPGCGSRRRAFADRRDMGSRSPRDAEIGGDRLLAVLTASSARTRCGVSLRAGGPASVHFEVDVGWVHTPLRARARSPRALASTPSVFGMKPDAPKSMQRLITAGSSLADTITTGTPGYCARRYISPEKPRTPGIARSSSTRSTSLSRSSSPETSSN